MTDNIYTALSKINKSVKAIGKNKDADMGNAGKYKFRGIDDMYNELHTLFSDNEVFILPKINKVDQEVQEKIKTWNGQETKSLQYSTLVEMTFTFTHSGGSSIEATGVGHAIDTSDKGTNKAQSSALKYCLMQMFLIPTEEDKDVENNNNEVGIKKEDKKKLEYMESVSTQQVDMIIALLEGNEIQKKTGYAHYKKIGSNTKIDGGDYDRIKVAIETAYNK